MRTRKVTALAAALQAGTACAFSAAIPCVLACAPAWAGPDILRQFEPRPRAEDFGPRMAAGTDARVFVDTLPVVCQRGHGNAVTAEFTLTLRRTAAGPGDAAASRVSFWDRGAEHFAMRVWSGREPLGTIKTLRWNLASLPPVGSAVLRNTGRGMRLLQGRDFSYAVADPASVLQAVLTYRCAEDPFSFATVEPVSVIGEYAAGLGLGQGPAFGAAAGPLVELPPRGRPLVPSRGDGPAGRIRRAPPFE